MLRASSYLAIAACFGLVGCVAAPPTGPAVVSMPGNGKDLTQFQRDDMSCRDYAQAQIGYASPARAANDSAVGSAILGTGLGAAAGAAIGAAAGNPGMGAAIGAGSGLLMGSAVGASNAQYSSAELQRRYDIGYAQCMTASGNKIEQPPQASVAYGYPGYAPGPYYYPAYPSYYGPPITGSIFIGGGWGGHHHHHHW